MSETQAAEDNSTSVLRVCASADEAPYSTRDASGFENKIATILAKAMGRDVLFHWSNKPAIYAVRDQLNMKLCDVVMGLDTGDDRVLTSGPYYTAPYVFIQRDDSKLDITNWSSPDLDKAKNIGVVQGTPPYVMMTKRGLVNENFNYMKSLTNFKSRRNQYIRVPPEKLIGDVSNGKAALAVAFAPEVARYVKANDDLRMIVIPDDNTRADGERVPHHFNQSLGVRKGDTDLLAALNAAIEKAKPEIDALLKEEGIPIVPSPPRT